MTALALLLALFAPILPPQSREVVPWPAVKVRSQDGRFAAELCKAPGQEKVRDALARWRLEVFSAPESGERSPIWSTFYPYAGRPRHFLLSDDGTTFVHVAETFSTGRPIVRIHREGEEVAALSGALFGVDRSALVAADDGPAWIATGGEPLRLNWRATEHGPWLALEIDSVDGVTRAVDVGTGLVLSADAVEQDLIRVHPGVPDDSKSELEPPFVTSFSAPDFIRAGATLEVHVAGEHPTPNWRLIGFEGKRTGERSHFVEIVPRTAPPKGGPQLQVLKSFRSIVNIDGLRVGSWQVLVRGREERAGEPITVEVLPARLFVDLQISGGVVNVSQRVSVYAPGVVEVFAGLRGGDPARFEILTRARAERIDSLLRGMPSEPRARASAIQAVNHPLVYQLGWWQDGQWVRTSVGYGEGESSVRGMVETLRELLTP